MRITLAVLLSLTLGLASLTAQNIEKIGVPEMEKLLSSPENILYVINFWATWCSPCVTELPYFEKLAKENKSGDVKFVLVSLDFPSQIDSKLIPFLKKNKITLEVKVMTDLDYNSWIERVDANWQGNIPSTLFFNNARGVKYFHPNEMTEKELIEIINKYK